MVGAYDLKLVFLSLFIVFFGCYCCVRLLPSVSLDSWGRSFFWGACSAFAFAIGTWSLHFLGLVSYKLPIRVGYDVLLTVKSFCYVFFGSLSAFLIVGEKKLGFFKLLIASLLLGSSIVAMHYTGMAAMLIAPEASYDYVYILISISIAWIGSALSLKMSHYFRRSLDRREISKIKAAIAMGCAIAGMHYTAMQGMSLADNSFCSASNSGVDEFWIVVLVFFMSVLALLMLLVVCFLDLTFYKLRQQLSNADFENKLLTSKAFSDHLTGVSNRYALESLLFDMLKVARQNKKMFAVFFIDLDGFKLVNDSYGHEVGDSLLCLCAERLRCSVRISDVVARIGGDEFVILSWVNCEADAISIKFGISDTLKKPFSCSGHLLVISGSIGCSLYPNDGVTYSELMISADKAMYFEKASEKHKSA